jgi:hypothetical protein
VGEDELLEIDHVPPAAVRAAVRAKGLIYHSCVGIRRIRIRSAGGEHLGRNLDGRTCDGRCVSIRLAVLPHAGV